MKKIISILLVCASLFALSVPAMAWEAPEPAIVVEQGARMTKEQLNPEYDGTQYEWNTTIAGESVNNYSNNGDAFAVAHDGDYLYIKTTMNYIRKYSNNYTNAHQHAEEFIYVDFNTGDGLVDNKIVLRVHYAAYSDGTNNHLTYDAIGLKDRSWSGAWGPEIYASVNKESAMNNGILVGRNGDTASTSAPAVAVYHVTVPLTEDVRNAIANGSCDIGIGFAYIQTKSTVNGYFTNCGEITLSDEDDVSNNFYNDISEDNLTKVTLQGAAQSTDAEIADAEIIGVQTTTIGEAGTTYSARFVAKLDTSVLANAKVGFRFVGDKTVDKNCTTVFNSILANGKAVPAWYLGADYLYCINLNDLVVGQTYALQIAAYYMDGDTVVPGTLYNVSIAADGTITASPLA